MEFIKVNNNPDPDIIAKKFKLVKSSVNFIHTKFDQEGKINIKNKIK